MSTSRSIVIAKKIAYGVFTIIWVVLMLHYYQLLMHYENNFNWLQTANILHLVIALETWLLLSIVMVTYCAFKLLE